MLDNISRNLASGSRLIIKHPQLVFTILLILIIPAAFLYSGQQFLAVATQNQSRLEADRIGTMQDVFFELVLALRDSPAALQAAVTDLLAHNSDVTKFRVVTEADNGLRILAAEDPALIGTLVDNPGTYRSALLNEGESTLFELSGGESRIAQTFRAGRDESGQLYYIFTEVSFDHIDTLFASRITQTYSILGLLLLIVLWLAYRHIRLIDYRYLYKQSQNAIATRDLFTNMVTHELRAPLTAMRGYASMIHENNAVEFAVREQALRIEQSSARLLLIVNDLLEVARLQSGRMKIERSDVDVCAIIKDVLATLESSAKEKGLRLSHDFHNEPCHFQTDPKRLAQIMTNLVSNAIKYTPEGVITVALAHENSKLTIRVQDTGTGITAEDQKKLFAPFFRVENEDVSKITGSGLGMWITKELVGLLGGKIGVESIKGVGTHVVVTLADTEKNNN